MDAFAKGHVVVLGPDEGSPPRRLSLRPARRRGEAIPITARLASLGIQVLRPGAFIRRHAHDRQHEALYLLCGRGLGGGERPALRRAQSATAGRGWLSAQRKHKIPGTVSPFESQLSAPVSERDF